MSRPACVRCNSISGTEVRELIRLGILFVPGREPVAA